MTPMSKGPVNTTGPSICPVNGPVQHFAQLVVYLHSHERARLYGLSMAQVLKV